MNRHERRAAKSQARKGAGDRIMSVHAFWRNDAPGGIGLVMDFEEGGDNFAAAAGKAMDFLDLHMTPERCLADLANLAKRWGAASDDEKERAIIMIQWLERRKHIKSDDFNGVVWYALRNGTLVMISESTPDSAVLREQGMADKWTIQELDTPDFERALRELLHGERAN